jgi:CelD/BcsL family acetyltransferase involved in cellulose biosynthesis
VRARVVSIDELAASEIDAWQDLADRAADPNPFFEPSFVLPAARHLGESVALAVVEDDGVMCLAMPIVAADRWRKLPVRVLKTLCTSQTFLGTPLVAQGHDVAAAAWRRLLELFAQVRPTPRLIVLEQLAADSVAAVALTGVSGAMAYETYERATAWHVLESAGLDDVLSGRHRRELRRRERLLAAHVGGTASTVVTRGDPNAIEEFVRLESAGWKGRGGTALASDLATAAFVRDAWAAFAEVGRFELLALRSSSAMIAGVGLLRAGGGVFMHKLAYDETFASFSPGVQLVADVYEWTRSNEQETWIDTCAAPGNAFANRLFPDRRAMATSIVPIGILGAVSGRSITVAANVVRALRRQG